MKKLFFIMSKLQTHHHFQLYFQKVDQHTEGKCLIHSAMTNSCKAWNSPVEYPSRESKYDIKEAEGNMFNPKLKGNVQERKHPGRCAFSVTESLNV